MRKLSDSITKGIRLIGAEGSAEHKYFIEHGGKLYFDTLALAALGAGGSKETGFIHKMMGVAAPDFIASHITNLLNAEFPCLFDRVEKYKVLVAFARSKSIYNSITAQRSVFSFVAYLNDGLHMQPTEIAVLLEGAGL